MHKKIDEWAELRGYRAACLGRSDIKEAIKAITTFLDDGAIDKPFFEKALSWIFDPDTGRSTEESTFILVAVPRPTHTVSFGYKGDVFELSLPPTYHEYSFLFESVKEDLENFLENQIDVRRCNAPLKRLAVMSGIARYGKNNIAYVEGMGSYFQLLGFAADIPLNDQNDLPLAKPEMLEECFSCKACTRICPTSAIDPERFLLHAERCLTYHSEYEGPLPAKFVHLRRKCLVGCLACQEVCPVNRGLFRIEKLPIHFEENETRLILGESTDSSLIPIVREKVAALKSNEFDYSSGRPNEIFRRNLTAVLCA